MNDGKIWRLNGPMSTTTKVASSSTSSVIEAKSLPTSLPDSENQRENKECELISTILECVYLYIIIRRTRLPGIRLQHSPIG